MRTTRVLTKILLDVASIVDRFAVLSLEIARHHYSTASRLVGPRGSLLVSRDYGIIS